MKKINKKGFTLVELLAVIVVLAIIMVVVVPSVTTSLNKAKKSSFLIYAQKMLNAAEQQYRTDELDGSMPSTYCYNIEYLSGGKSSSYKGFVKVTIEDYEVNTYISMFDQTYSVGITSGVASGISFAEVEQLKNNSSGSINKGGNFTLTSPCGSSNTKGDATIEGKEESSSNSSVNAAQLIASKMEKESNTMTTDDDNNIRYDGRSGGSPNNYVKFNNETWRIIGVFNVDAENKSLKIIREYDSNFNYTIDTSYWPESNLQKYLNGDYYNSLTNEAKSQIYETTWYLGGVISYNIDAYSFYAYERQRTSGSYFAGTNKTWTGKIGIMYASDYAYAGEIGSSYFNWLITYYSGVQATMTPIGDSYQSQNTDKFITYSASSGQAYIGNINETSINYRPSLYLNPNIKISGGSGTQSDPYILSL